MPEEFKPGCQRPPSQKLLDILGQCSRPIVGPVRGYGIDKVNSEM